MVCVMVPRKNRRNGKKILKTERTMGISKACSDWYHQDCYNVRKHNLGLL